MSKKNTNNLRGLLLQILFTLLFCAVLIVYAIFTRPKTLATAYTISKLSYSRAATVTVSQSMRYTLDEVVIALRQVREELSKQQEQNSLANELLTSDNPYVKAAIYDHYIYEIVANYYSSLNPELVRAIVYHESRYDESRVNSKTNATGLMQLLPKWHMERAKNLGVYDLKDPYGNILVGCDYLNSLFESYSYDYALNLYAGGYPYANDYKKSTSPFIKELNAIMSGLEKGTIIPGGG